MAGEEGTAHAASAGGHGLAKKIGPLPIWAWAAVVLGSYLLFHYLKNRSAATSAATTGTVGGSNNAPPLGLQVTPNGQIVDPTTGNVIGTVGTGGTGNSGPNTTSVQGWLAAAQGALQGLGLDNNTINGALNDYIAGTPLPQAEYNIVNEAIKIVGSPPTTLGNPALAPPAPNTNPSPGPQSPVTNSSNLPSVNPDLFQQIYKFGQYSAGDFTQIGEVINGQYQGSQVSNGVPVFTNIFGGMAQGVNWGTLPSNNGQPYGVYIPSQYVAYENPSGTQRRPLAAAA